MGALAPFAITTDDLAGPHDLSRDQVIELVFELSRDLEFLGQAIEGSGSSQADERRARAACNGPVWKHH